MAKVHINKALQLDAKDEIALKVKPLLDKLTQPSAGQSTNPTKTTQSQQSDRSKNGGLFGGMFGGKKK